MNLYWTDLAAERLRQLQQHIGRDSPLAALHQAERIVDSVEQLARFPHSGRLGRIPGTRELVIPRTPYIVAYRVREKMIELLSIEHSAREWPHHF